MDRAMRIDPNTRERYEDAPPYPDHFSGIPVIIQDPLAGAPVLEVRQNRKHWRSKVNKKWRRRYGVTTIYGPMGYMFGGKLIANTPFINQLKARLTQPLPTAPRTQI
jgi:hypothetical protein